MEIPPDIAFIEYYLKNKFSRPFLRRFTYLYFGLSHPPDIFVLSDTEDGDFKYCEPMQITGLARIDHHEHLSLLRAWFATLGITSETPCIFYFAKFLTLLNKIPRNAPSPQLTRHPSGIVTASGIEGMDDIVIARPIDHYFTLLKLNETIARYCAIFFERQQKNHTITPTVDKPPKVKLERLSFAELHAAGLRDQPCGDIKLVLIPGIDFIMTKSLTDQILPGQCGVRIWAEHPQTCFRYGGFYQDPTVSLCAGRTNIHIFPMSR